jgi:hypothetical protein
MSQMGATHERNKAGAVFQNITTSDVKEMPIPMPPLAEQERIVKVLNEADELRKLRVEIDRRSAALVPAFFHELFGQHIEAPPIVTSTVGLKAPRKWRWANLTEVARRFSRDRQDYRSPTPGRLSCARAPQRPSSFDDILGHPRECVANQAETALGQRTAPRRED